MYVYVYIYVYIYEYPEGKCQEWNQLICMYEIPSQEIPGWDDDVSLSILNRMWVSHHLYTYMNIFYTYILFFVLPSSLYMPIWNHHAHIHRHINIFCSYLLSRPCQTRLGNAKYSSPLHLFLNKIADHDVDPSCLSEASLDFVCICRNRVSYILWDLRWIPSRTTRKGVSWQR